MQKPKRYAWSATHKLQWSYFEGFPQYNSNYAATANTGLSHSIAINRQGFYDRENSKVLAHFYPTFSWYRASDTSATILRHEQAHFDITEIHARKLRKRIANFTFSNQSQTEVKALYQEIEKERQLMQRVFDHDTKHSRDIKQEFIWESNIAKMLKDLAPYKAK